MENIMLLNAGHLITGKGKSTYSLRLLGIDYMPLHFSSSMPAGFVEDYCTEKEIVHFKLQWSPDKALVLDSDTFYLARLWMECRRITDRNVNYLIRINFDNWSFERPQALIYNAYENWG